MKTKPACDIIIMSYSGFFIRKESLCQIEKEITRADFSGKENANERTVDTNIVIRISKVTPAASTVGNW